jgi:hypothetical protein
MRSWILSGLILGLVVFPARSESGSPRFTVVLSKSDSTGCIEVDGSPVGKGDRLLDIMD